MVSHDFHANIVRAFDLINPDQFSDFDNHERLVHVCDSRVGLCGFVAIHSTALGPAIGGTRYASYPHQNAAICDALRLSRGMSFKCALAGLPYGGGKGVLMATLEGARARSRAEMLGAYALALSQIGVEFFTGEDVGIEQRDVEILEAHSDHIVGRPSVGGMPAPWAAQGVFVAIKAAIQKRLGSDSLDGRVFAVKGLGAVGLTLCKLLSDAGGGLVLADVEEFKVEQARAQFPKATIVSTDDIHAAPCDVFAPCALRNSIDETTVEQLACKIICGAENNQLTSDQIGSRLHARGILYVPDFVANAGGLITVADELEPGGYSQQRVQKRVTMIGETVRQIIELSQDEDRPTNHVANEIAKQRIRDASLSEKQPRALRV